jgi:cyclopropane fatty-acyl-phospholipid synthase-like methyltransferase
MSNVTQTITAKLTGAHILACTKQFIFGLAADFWKDAPYDPAMFRRLSPLQAVKNLRGKKKDPASPLSIAPTAAMAAPIPPVPQWHAPAGEIAEKMWGEGHVLPAGNQIMDMLIASLTLKPEQNLLDLSAGLGGALRKLAGKASLINGMETDIALAQRGTEISARGSQAQNIPIIVYSPVTFAMPATFDRVVARELFYRVTDKASFFTAIGGCLRGKGEIAFTDYIVDAENKDKPAILGWQAFEKGAAPIGLIDMAQAWAKAGFEMRASDDQTDLYKHEVLAGLKRLSLALGQSKKPDAETRQSVLHNVELWMHRMAAFDQGMKFYRFHAVRQG